MPAYTISSLILAFRLFIGLPSSELPSEEFLMSDNFDPMVWPFQVFLYWKIIIRK